MKGDFTRSTFKPEKHYSRVSMQQGRVQIDADWNEQNDINSHRINTEARDSMGPCGAPLDGGGFKIDTSDPNNPTISHGRIYVDGILCENSKDIGITAQEDLPNYFPDNKLPDDPGVYLAYLDVWQRHMTAIEDPYIREVALGGPDTATRTKTVWQVKLCFVQSEQDATINCGKVQKKWNDIIAGSSAQLTAFTNKVTPSKKPCIVSPGAGYRGLENQLYRVEIHTGGDFTKAKFKWSHDNGSVVFAIEDFVKDANKKATKLKVRQLGKDKTHSLKAGDWVEVLDDATELSDNPAGTLAQIKEDPDVAGRIITLRDIDIISGYDIKTRHARVRRWDMGSDAISVKPAIGHDSIELEDGIFVKFSETSFKAGDYWLIPARTATGDIEWPMDESKKPKSVPCEGIQHNYCRLAVLQQDSGNNWKLLSDCRRLFPAVTELTSFFHVCGDGQEAMPGEKLPESLQVGVSNGKLPVNDARVKFEIMGGGGGTLSAGSQVSNNSLVVKTGSDGVGGVAKCTWTLGVMDMENKNVPPPQLVKATLLDACGATINIPLFFNANLSVASEVAYKPPGCTLTSNDIPTVQKLLIEKIKSWPKDDEGNTIWPKDDAGNTTVKDVLDTLLCKLEAGEIPYNPVIKEDRWKDINEIPKPGTSLPYSVQDALDNLVANLDSGDIPYDPLIQEDRWKDINEIPDSGMSLPNTVQNALDDLVANLDSSDIPYRPSCDETSDPTVRSLLNIPASSDSNVKDILDALLCRFNADDLPIEKNDVLCKKLKEDANIITVQDALNKLCKDRQGICTHVIEPRKDWEDVFGTIEDEQDANICFQIGEFVAYKPIVLKNKGHIRISGSGSGTIIKILEGETIFQFEECKSVVIKDLYCESGVAGFDKKIKLNSLNGTLTFCACPKVTIKDVELTCASGIERAASCINVRDAVDYNPYENRSLFCWGAIPGDDNHKLMEFLQKTYSIDNETDKISKEDNIISVDFKNISISLVLNSEKNRVYLKTDDGRTDEFIAMEDKKTDKLNIYLISKVKPVESVHIHNCDLHIGLMQVGIILINVQSAHVEDNVLNVSKTPESLPLDVLLRNERYRSAIRSLMIPAAHLGKPEKVFEDTNVVRIEAGKGYVWFRPGELLVKAWEEWSINKPKGVQNDSDLLSHLIHVADQVLLNANYREKYDQFKIWYDDLEKLNVEAGSQGIVIGGSSASDVNIINNRIKGVIQGIHVGISHRGVTPDTYHTAGIVHIINNNIDVMLPPYGTRERHGIFVGNCNSLIIQNNFASVTRTGLTGELNIDGIRVYGHIGKMMIIRQNHLVDYTQGIHFWPINELNDELSRQWVITDNMAEHSTKEAVFLWPENEDWNLKRKQKIEDKNKQLERIIRGLNDNFK